MAEGWTRQIHAGAIDVASAGIEKHGLNPLAVAVMAEVGVDISRQTSNTLDEVILANDSEIDLVVTVCTHADKHCPQVPAAKARLHAPFDDPPRLAKDAPDRESALNHYRRVRDEIRAFVAELPCRLEERKS